MSEREKLTVTQEIVRLRAESLAKFYSHPPKVEFDADHVQFRAGDGKILSGWMTLEEAFMWISGYTVGRDDK